MGKVEALENIKDIWNDNKIDLENKILGISNHFYSSGLDLESTASFLNATPSELDALLSLAGLDEEVIKQISALNPPATVWTFFANANYDEIEEALKTIQTTEKGEKAISELVYKSMIEVSGVPTEQKINLLTASELKHIREKGEQYKKLTDKEINFIKSLSARKGKGLALTEKQIDWLKGILNNLANAEVITRNSKDNDQELCDKVLDCLDR